MIIKPLTEDYIQNEDDVSCVTGVTEITGPLFISQDRRIYLPEFFQHAVEEVATESKKKCSDVALYHIQDFMHAINHNPINGKDLTHNEITKDFLCLLATYMSNYAMHKTKVKFADGNSSFSKNSA